MIEGIKQNQTISMMDLYGIYQKKSSKINFKKKDQKEEIDTEITHFIDFLLECNTESIIRKLHFNLWFNSKERNIKFLFQ